jgi:uncharacterized protein (DUF849 family)
MSNKKIINFTPTGTQTTRENSYAPLTPDEIIEEVHMAYDLGITMTHIHARDPETFENSYKKEIYGPIIEGIRKHCPDLTICVSLTGRLYPEFEKRSEVLRLYPDMGSLTMSSLNFPKGASQNDPSMIIRLIEAMNEYGVNPEIECFDSGMLNYTTYLQEKYEHDLWKYVQCTIRRSYYIIYYSKQKGRFLNVFRGNRKRSVEIKYHGSIIRRWN